MAEIYELEQGLLSRALKLAGFVHLAAYCEVSQWWDRVKFVKGFIDVIDVSFWKNKFLEATVRRHAAAHSSDCAASLLLDGTAKISPYSCVHVSSEETPELFPECKPVQYRCEERPMYGRNHCAAHRFMLNSRELADRVPDGRCRVNKENLRSIKSKWWGGVHAVGACGV